ncbi:tRNA dihydrouridine synthase [Diatrype stigma]|uniref:tRNA dihydrouridine synthase n=1 Tax=Diatrype stigma TaxID=117547 RepID=A0AAN9YNN8_9PEZI
MDPETEDESLYPKLHPLKLFDLAKSQKRYLYTCAPMVRYSKLAFRQTVHAYGTDLCWTPMILAKEFNRSSVARDSDLTMSTSHPQPPTIAQFGASDPAELARAASLVAPFVNGVDLNCGCPQSWACAGGLGAALMGRRELVRDAVVATRRRLADDGWAVSMTEGDVESPRGRSVSIKIRVHADLRRTVDFIETVLADNHGGGGGWSRNIDWLTVHPRTRSTPSSTPINLEALALLAEKFGERVPILVSGDVFTLSGLPYTSSHLLPEPQPTFTTTTSPSSPSSAPSPTDGVDLARPKPPDKLPIPNLAGLMSARALLANPALFAGYDACPWEAVDTFMRNVARAPLPLKLGIHHLTEMCGPGLGPEKQTRALLTKRERVGLVECQSWIDVIDFLEGVRLGKGEGVEGWERSRSKDGVADHI